MFQKDKLLLQQSTVRQIREGKKLYLAPCALKLHCLVSKDSKSLKILDTDKCIILGKVPKEILYAAETVTTRKQLAFTSLFTV